MKYFSGLTDPTVLLPIVVVIGLGLKTGMIGAGSKTPKFLVYVP